MVMTSETLDATFAALADPTRRAILSRLATGGEASVTELAAPFAMSLPAVSKHLKVLEHAGLISRGREAQWRPCRLEALPLKEALDWMEPYKRFWEESFDRLDDYLKSMATFGRSSATCPKRSGRRSAVCAGRSGPPRPRPSSRSATASRPSSTAANR